MREKKNLKGEEESLASCIECGNPYRNDLVNGLCQDCRELMEAEMDLEDKEMT